MLIVIDKWRYYLEKGQIIIKTNHERLKFLLQQRLHTNLQRKGMAKLMRLNYVIQFRRGKGNVVVDAMLRCHEEGSNATITTLVPNWY